MSFLNRLNEYNDKTKRVIHLMVTSLCVRGCKFCCNKQYNLNDIPYVNPFELKNCEILCLTGGEPFLFSNPCSLAEYFKDTYPNIKKVYVYTNAAELSYYLKKNKKVYGIDGVDVSIKVPIDKREFAEIIKNESIQNLTDNRLYVFDNNMPENVGNFEVFKREWQPIFIPADDSIFRKI